MFFWTINECERIRSLGNLFNFRESEKSLTMDSRGGFFFVSLVPQAQKRDKIIPESTLLKNGSSIEYTIIRTVDRPDRKRGNRRTDVTSNFSLTSVTGHKIARQSFHV